MMMTMTAGSIGQGQSHRIIDIIIIIGAATVVVGEGAAPSTSAIDNYRRHVNDE